jgi:predicted ABC-type ATPase
MAESSKPTLWLVAGPNGVGKTTYAYRYIRAVSGSVHFVNLDEIARGLSPLDPSVAREASARIALSRIRSFVSDQQSFTLETTLAGRTHLRTLDQARMAGFEIRLLYFMVPTPDICLARVARRVVEGGHDVPEVDVRRRFARSIANFPDYICSVDRWQVLDNSRFNPSTAAEGRRGCLAVERDTSGLPYNLLDQIRALPSCLE